MMYKLRQVSTEILRQCKQTFLKICLQKHFKFMSYVWISQKAKPQPNTDNVCQSWPNITHESEKSYINTDACVFM